MIIAEALREAARRLAVTSDTARLDAEVLMAHVLGTTRSKLLLERLEEPCPAAFAALIDRRAVHEPVAYITGRQEFYGREFTVTPAVLIPRADSETVIEAALEVCPQPRRVLDCGVGSGALLVTALAERPGACGVGIDRSPAALAVAKENARAHLPQDACRMILADWTQPGWHAGLGRFDLVLANPPYVEADAKLAPSVRDYEPAGALFAGEDGLDDYRILIPQIPRLLAPGGRAVLEIGAKQGAAVSELAKAHGFLAGIKFDLAGRPRAVVLGKKR